MVPCFEIQAPFASDISWSNFTNNQAYNQTPFHWFMREHALANIIHYASKKKNINENQYLKI